jgi:hypothetical protein
MKMVKQGKSYTAFYTLDELTYYRFCPTYTFGDGSPTYLGFCAFQGENEPQQPVTLQVDYFRVESLPPSILASCMLLLLLGFIIIVSVWTTTARKVRLLPDAMIGPYE